MAKTTEERLVELEAQNMAMAAVLYDLIWDAWPLEQHRKERRDSACRAVEAVFGSMEPSAANHDLVQRILGEVERLFEDPF